APAEVKIAAARANADQQKKRGPEPARRKAPALPEPGEREDRGEITEQGEEQRPRRHVARDERRARDQLIEDRIVPLRARRRLVAGARADQVLQIARQAGPLRERRPAHVEGEINDPAAPAARFDYE